jgi:hypothetical protein
VGDCLRWTGFLKITEGAIFCLLLMLTTTGWATLWVIFAQTHLVTLKAKKEILARLKSLGRKQSYIN